MYLIHRSSPNELSIYRDGVLISKSGGYSPHLDEYESEFIEQARQEFADYIHNGRYWTLDEVDNFATHSWVSYALETKLKQARLLTFYGDIVSGSQSNS